MAKEVWMWLAAGLGYGAVNTGEVLAAFPGGAMEVYNSLGGAVLDDILTQKQAEKLAKTRPEDFAIRLNHAAALGIQALAYDDPQYPGMLRSIATPPPMLFVKGDVTLMNGQLSIGMVGARRPSAYGVEAVKAVGRGVALGGAIIVSGLAAGLDAEAHKAALAVNGPTIACIAFGHDTCYPAANRQLMELIERYGAVISEYPLGTTAEKPYFLQRNRLIAGLSHGLVVGEARRHSGTMSTVNFAAEYGRDVFAIPGSIFSELSTGTNAMIREGAYLAATAGDVLAVYNIQLQGEDPVAAAMKQSAEGRPAAAAAQTPVWQQSLSRGTAPREEKARPAAESPWQQTLAEALQGELGKNTNGVQVSSKEALEAFRKIQKSMPAVEKGEQASSLMLEEMVLAVSDSVEIHSTPKKEARPLDYTEDGRAVQAFSWAGVERITREEVIPPPEPPRPSTRQPDAPPARKPDVVAPVQPVGRVGSVQPVAPVVPVAPPHQTAAVARPEVHSRAQAHHAQAAQPRPQAVQAPPAAATRNYADSLSSKLRTMQAKAEIGTENGPAVTYTPPRKPPQPTSTYSQVPVQEIVGKLSAEAKASYSRTEELYTAPPLPEEGSGLSRAAQQALRQLGVTPVPLSTICDKSGLTSGEAMAALTELELAGLSRQLAGRQFVIMQ